MKRSHKNPLITPDDVKPSFEGLQVDCVFNAGVTEYDGETILLLRVAESVISTDDNIISFPILSEKDGKYEMEIKSVNKEEMKDVYDFSDSRSLWTLKNRQIAYLTSLSHFRIAKSKNGLDFEIDDKPTIMPYGEYEMWGMEDARITKLEDTYYINYTSVSKYGASTSLITTKDFKEFNRVGVIFPPENKDVSIFPEKINGLYFAYHRPVPKAIGNPDIWSATSPDLVHWGNHKHVLGVSDKETWENGRIGGGAPSFKTDKGWVHIYHAADKTDRYCLGAFLADLDDPSKIIAKTDKPILFPSEDYETEGFFGNVVFTCGITKKGDDIMIYYGGADTVMAVVETTVTEILNALGV